MCCSMAMPHTVYTFALSFRDVRDVSGMGNVNFGVLDRSPRCKI